VAPVLIGVVALACGAWLRPGAAPSPAAPRYLDAETARIYAAPPASLAERRAQDIAFWQRKAAEDPQSADAMAQVASLTLQRARETADQADVRAAEVAARAAIARRPAGNGASRSLLVNTLLAQHRFAEALDEATRTAREAPGIPEYLALRGECEMEAGAYDRARATFDTVARGPLPLSAIGRLARWRELTGDLVTARHLLARGVADVQSRTDLSPEQGAWWQLRLGEVAVRAGERRRARQAFEAGLALRPEDHRLHAALARLDAAEGRWREARAHGDAVLAVQLDPVTLGVMADAARALGDTTAATRAEAALAAAVSDTGGPVHRPWLLREADDRSAAARVAALARADVAVRPDVGGWELLAWALDRAGDALAADSAMARALALGTRDAALWYRAAVIAHDRRQEARARALLDSALALNDHFDHRHAAHARALRDSLEAPHAMHTSLAKVAVEGDTAVRVQLRLFTDDFTVALAAATRGGRPDTLAFVGAGFTLRADGGAPLAWRACEARTEQDMTILCLRARVPRRPARVQVVHRLLLAQFSDQVNIVQVALGGGARSLFFTRGADGAQEAP
jgi:tetratricopeptide (TPR) repeat protein